MFTIPVRLGHSWRATISSTWCVACPHSSADTYPREWWTGASSRSLLRERRKAAFVLWTEAGLMATGNKNQAVGTGLFSAWGPVEVGAQLGAQLLRIWLVWQWFGAKLLHFLRTQPHIWTSFGPFFCTKALCSDRSRHSGNICPNHVTLWVEEKARP